MLNSGDAEGFAKKLAEATNRVVEDYMVGDVVHEEPFSDQLCGRLKETLVEFETPMIRWQTTVAVADRGRGRLSARTLTKTKEEPAFGADLVVVLDIETPALSVCKGFLAQAKRLEPGKALARGEHERLIGQCEAMLTITPSSMVFLYSRLGVYVIPATAVLAHGIGDLWKIETYGIEILYMDFAMCWFGDPKIQATDEVSLEGLRLVLDAPAAIKFKGRSRPAPG